MRVIFSGAVTLAAVLACGDPKPPESAALPGVDTVASVEQPLSTPQRVELSEEAAKAAGIRVEPVRPASSTGTEGLDLPGEVQFDPRRVALISPRLRGRVEELLVVEGEQVSAGQVVARLSSPSSSPPSPIWCRPLAAPRCWRRPPIPQGLWPLQRPRGGAWSFSESQRRRSRDWKPAEIRDQLWS